MAIRTCVVLGGGVAGLTLAEKLSSAGVHVTLLEKSDRLGGLSRGILIDGTRVDLGPHSLRAKDDRVLKYWKSLLGDDLLKTEIYARVYFLKSFLNYPIQPFEILRLLPLHTVVSCGLSLAWARIRSKFVKPNFLTYEGWATSNYGRKLYDIFFAPLTEKVWGVPASSMDGEYARKRLAPLSLRQIFLNWFPRPRNALHPEDPRWTSHYYPRFGVFEICEKLSSILVSRNVDIRLSCCIREIVEDADGVRVFVDGSKEPIRADYVASSIPLASLAALYSDLRALPLGKIVHRGTAFLYLSVRDTERLSVACIVSADRESIFNRISDFSYFSKDLCPPGKNILCIEFNADLSDRAGLEQMAIQIKERVRATGIVPLDHIFDEKIETEPYVYPMYLKGYRTNLRNFLSAALKHSRLLCMGRQGLFAHKNIDQVMISAFNLADILTSGHSLDTRVHAAYYKLSELVDTSNITINEICAQAAQPSNKNVDS